MDKQTIHLITLIIAIIGSNAWSHTSLSDRISEVESRLSDRINEVESRLSDRISEVESKLSDRMTALETRVAALETRVDGIDKRLVIVETSLKANNQYIARVLSQGKSRTPATP